jgi:hypothetical protein
MTGSTARVGCCRGARGVQSSTLPLMSLAGEFAPPGYGSVRRHRLGTRSGVRASGTAPGHHRGGWAGYLLQLLVWVPISPPYRVALVGTGEGGARRPSPRASLPAGPLGFLGFHRFEWLPFTDRPERVGTCSSSHRLANCVVWIGDAGQEGRRSSGSAAPPATTAPTSTPSWNASAGPRASSHAGRGLASIGVPAPRGPRSGAQRQARTGVTVWYEQLRDQYRPDRLKVLLIGESPPDPAGKSQRSERYSYTFESLALLLPLHRPRRDDWQGGCHG